MVALIAISAANAFGEPALQFHSEPAHPAYGSVDLQGVDARLMEELRHAKPSVGQWQTAFSISVQDASMFRGDRTVPSVLGNYEILQDRVRFTPRYPLTPGLTFRATVDLEELFAMDGATLSDLDTPVELSLSFSLPTAAVVPSTMIEAVYPSANVVPENLLRFYVHFSSPMQQGWARDFIYLRGPDGQRLGSAFLDLRTELWDPTMQRLTLLLDPGRIKRGVGPNVEGGAPLRQGESYTLVIDADMKDASDNPLRQGYTKTFQVTMAMRERVNPEVWSFVEPIVGTQQALELRFPEPLDRAMLARVIRVVGADGQPIAGRIAIDQHETRWAFTPSASWSAGEHQILVNTALEDVSGNNIIAPFDIDTRHAEVTEKADRIALPFEPRVVNDEAVVMESVAVDDV
jgi:hypothetical protein